MDFERITVRCDFVWIAVRSWLGDTDDEEREKGCGENGSLWNSSRTGIARGFGNVENLEP